MPKHQILAALAGALVALPLQAAPGDIPEKRLFGKYDKYQAAPQPAATGTKTAPTAPTRTETKTASPATKLSPGNERIAYAIAKGALAEHGIKNPTQEQIKTALNGGTVTTKSGERVTMPGVLKLRDKGMGWGQIAQKHGFKLGEVMGRGHDKHHKHAHKHDDGKRHGHKHADKKHADKHHHHKHAHRHEHKKHAHDWKHHKHERADWKHQRPDFHRAKHERPEKFERPHKHERPERPEKHGRGR